jgi:hypothetical protein
MHSTVQPSAMPSDPPVYVSCGKWGVTIEVLGPLVQQVCAGKEDLEGLS